MFESIKMFDRNLLLKINSMHTPLMDRMMFYLSNATWILIVIILVVAVMFYRKYTLKKAIEFMVGCAIVFASVDLSTNLIKHAVKRYRPTHNIEIKDSVHVVNDYRGGKYGFYSAHAANNFGIIAFIFFCVHWVNKNYRYLLFVYPIIIIYSRVYLGVHYPSDVIAGIVWGIFMAWLVYLIMNKHFLKLDEEKS